MFVIRGGRVRGRHALIITRMCTTGFIVANGALRLLAVCVPCALCAIDVDVRRA
jgi:hypothetical protein